MKTVNLKSLIKIYDKNGGINIPSAYMNYLSSPDYKLTIHDGELSSLKSLILTLENNNSELNLNHFDNFFIGYKIPQINKEFDLLRISKSMVLNIEYKSEYTDSVRNQLYKNRYYLNFLKPEIKLFTYIENENKLYKLNDVDELIEADCQELIEIIKKQCSENIEKGNLNDLFKPSNYLISPFTKTEEFIKGEYFLTQEQEEKERELINDVSNGGRYFMFTGQAGTGKTLLMYHLAKKYKEARCEVGFIHVGNLHSGHYKLKEQYGWNIQPIKEWKSLFNVTHPRVIIIDEIQRVKSKYKYQILGIIEQCKNFDIILIVGGDKKQILANDEGEVIEQINNSVKWKKFNLRGKIRTNKELANFIIVMLDLTRKHHIEVSNRNVNIVYFDTIKEARQYIDVESDYKYISYTPNTGNYSPKCEAHLYNFSQSETSHGAVGQ